MTFDLKYFNRHKEISSIKHIDTEVPNLSDSVVRNVNFITHPIHWENANLENAVFMGCEIPEYAYCSIHEKGGTIFPAFKGLPYDPYRTNLYNWTDLMEGYNGDIEHTVDFEIYQSFYKSKFDPPLMQALSQRIHDHAMDNALRDLLGSSIDGKMKKKTVGFMGGHGIARGSKYYTKTAFTAKYLTEKGYFVLTGGGPGIMEAANLGAYMANQRDKELLSAIEILKEAPCYFSEGYVERSFDVLAEFPTGHDSLAIPTWFYGHEPSNLFSKYIAKYFSNSIREDNLLALCLHGIIYAPGSAGTTQEIFQDATQNHYGTYNYYSPMVFLGMDHYTKDTQIWQSLQKLSRGEEYSKLLYISDEPMEIASFIELHPPIYIE